MRKWTACQVADTIGFNCETCNKSNPSDSCKTQWVAVEDFAPALKRFLEVAHEAACHDCRADCVGHCPFYDSYNEMKELVSVVEDESLEEHEENCDFCKGMKEVKGEKTK